MFTITNAIVAALAVGAVQARPQGQVEQPSAVASTVPAPTPAPDALFDDLLTAPTAVKRFQRLLVDSAQKLISGKELRDQIVFPFNPNTAPPNGSTGGVAVGATIQNFPILTGLGIATTVGFLNPCGINTPHVHPRATEFLTLVEGENLEFGFVLENGLVKAGENPEVAGYLNQFEGTVFPQGSVHYQFNNNCKKATFVAALNSEDPGTNQVAQALFALNSDVVNATLGFPSSIDGKNIKDFGKYLPANLAQDIKNCLAKCPGQY